MPTVAFHDLVIHPRDADLVAGTHGRSIWILDDITPLQQLTPEVMRSDVHLFKNRIVTKWQNVSIGRQQSFFKFRGENPPRGAFKKTPDVNVKITIEDENFQNQYKSEITITGKPGVNIVNWNMRFPVPKKDVMKFKERLMRILNELAVLVKTDEEKDEISELQETVKIENTQRSFS